MAGGAGRDFFVSYTGVNESWARWICVQLEQAGYTTVSQALDFRPGQDFVNAMQVAVTSATRTIAVLSPAYFESQFGEAEWQFAFQADPSGERGLLVPVRVQPCRPPGLLAARVYVDLVDLDEQSARERLLAAVGPPPPRPTAAPFPGEPRGADGGSRFPGAGPAVSNLPSRNRHFSGRDELLETLHARMRAAPVAAVLPWEALHGLGGVGKTELTVEFAHRFSSDYDIVWWIPAEQPVTAAAALAELADRLGVPAAADQTARIEALFDVLRRRDRWLLIYDNAEDPDTLRGLVPPAGGGRVLVTSRWAAWGRLAEPLRVDVLGRAESVAFLTRRTGLTDPDRLAALAELVGDLPLALEEAAACLEETRVGLDAYLILLRDRARDLLGLAAGTDPVAGLAGLGAAADQRRVATVWSVSLEQIKGRAPGAESLMTLCAFLAPDIPRTLPVEHSTSLPAALATLVTDPLAYNKALRVLGEFSLIDLGPATLTVHRLVQAVVRARLRRPEEQEWAQQAVMLIRASFPDDSWDTSSWRVCERLLPHLLAAVGHAERLAVAGEDAGWLLDRASTYQQARGQYRQALPLAQRALAVTAAALGPDHAEVAWRHDELGRVLWALGELTGARTQFDRALQIGEAALGPDHPDIATWRGDLGGLLLSLGDVAGARAQIESALQISEAALGPDHPSLGIRHGNLGSVLRALGDLPGARNQYERALQISEAALGPDHPTISIRRGNLGGVLRDLGDLAGARVQIERALQISEAALGPDHPDIATWRGNLGEVLMDLGDLPGARVQIERALQISEAALGPDHPAVRELAKSLASLTGAIKENRRGSVFVSHATADSVFASRLAETLKTANVDVLDNHTVDAGSSFASLLRSEIARADSIVVLMSPEYFASKWCQVELSAAMAEQKTVLPIHLRGSTPSPLSHFTSIDGRAGPQAAAEAIVDALRRAAM